MAVDQLSIVFGALADPTRRAILARLTLGDARVAELAAPFNISQPAVSKHLKVLEEAGLISRHREATARLSHLEAAPLREAMGQRGGGLFLDSNQLSGNIPPELGKLSLLDHLDLSNNQLTGSIPPELGKLNSLLYLLDLSNNQLSGSIPPELGRSGAIVLDLSNNQLSGSIPPELGKTGSYSLDISNNQLSGSIPPGLGKSGSIILDLSGNQLSGSIPPGLGNLKNIGELNLSHNNLTGAITASFSNLTTLAKLNVANNSLSGTVPSFLTTLSNLQRLYLLHNRFTFDGLETIAQHDFKLLEYDPQKKIHIHQTGNMLSVYAGGTLSNNIYKWFKDGAFAATIAGDSTYQPATSGAYTVQVTNSIATALTLKSDAINYAAGKGLIASQTNDLITRDKGTRVSVYPNPAITSVTVALTTTGNYSIQLTDLSGRVLQRKTGNATNSGNTIQLTLVDYSRGVYLITVSNDRNQNQTFRINKE